MEIKGSKVFITGAAGFVGSHIADQLLENGAAKVIGLDNLVRGSLENVERAKATGRFELVTGCDHRGGLARLVDGDAT